jgi:hypothetical protein
MCQGAISGLHVAGKRLPQGYAIEARIPLTAANFPQFRVGPGAVFGLDCALDDADDGGDRKVQMVWQGSAANCQDTSLFARLQF